MSKNYAIVESRDGRIVRYGYATDYKYRPPDLTPPELAALLLAQESIAAAALTPTGSPFAKYGQSLLSKVRASLPEILREKLDSLATVLGSATVPAKDFTPYSATIECLTKAAVEQRCVILTYYTMTSEVTRERRVEPYCIYFDPEGATLKLIGLDHYRNQITPFSIDHIRSITETSETFVRPSDFNLREYLTANCFNGIHGEPVTIRLRAYGVTARIFAERKFHPSQMVLESTNSIVPSSSASSSSAPSASTPSSSAPSTSAPSQGSSGRCARIPESTTIEMRVARGRGLVRFILGWGAEVEVISPLELRDEITNAHRSALNIYSASKIEIGGIEVIRDR